MGPRAESCVRASPENLAQPVPAACAVPYAFAFARCVPARGRCARNFDTGAVTARTAWRYDGTSVAVVDEGRAGVTLPPSHDWDNRGLGMRSDMRGERVALCRRCGARVALWWGSLIASPRPLGHISMRGSIGPCPNETRTDLAFPSSLLYQGLDVLGDVRVGTADMARESFVRASGDVVCDCGHPYRDHPKDPVDDYLQVLCNGTRVKL